MPVDSDIRRWFLKQPHKKDPSELAPPKSDTTMGREVDKSTSDLKNTSKYFAEAKSKPIAQEAKPTTEKVSPAKRKQQHADTNIEKKSVPSPKKPRSAVDESNDTPKGTTIRKTGIGNTIEAVNAGTPGRKDTDKFAGVAKGDFSSPVRGRGRAASASLVQESKESPATAGKGRGGGGRGHFPQQRGPPPHKGEKEVPEGAEDCLANLTFVISGTLDSLEREEAEDLIKRHGGRVTSAVSKKTNFLLADEDIGGRKSAKAKELGVSFLTEEDLFEMIRVSKRDKGSSVKETVARKSGQKEAEARKLKTSSAEPSSSAAARIAEPKLSVSLSKSAKGGLVETEAWTQKHQPRISIEIIGNQSIVKQLHDWLQRWDEQHLHGGHKGKRRGGGSGSGGAGKKAVLLSGSPGIGKTTTARLISKELGFEALEVNASDNRGKADSKVGKGIGGSLANTIKEMVSNESLTIGDADRSTNHRKSVLIMDEVDGMSGGDRGGIADLIASIKTTRIPIICICNDRYSQKLKSLVNHCLALNFRKPTKQQMAKRLQQIALAEGLQVDEIALEELAQRVNGDMRMALNQLQYMSLRSQVVKYADVKARLNSSAKDEDITPFNAVDRLMGYEGGRLRMDDRLDSSMSDPDLVPLLIQENYLNYCPSLAGRDENGTARMDLAARAAASIADGDIVNVQIRRYRQWQHSQMGAFMSSIIPAALMHGRREVLVEGERNFNRFGAWLGKNSSFGKKLRLLEDVHVHLVASRLCEPTREAVRLDSLHLLQLHLTHPLRNMSKESAVQAVVDFMEEYSLTQEDFETILDLSNFQGHRDALAGVQPAVKTALTKAYRQREHNHRVKSADLLPTLNIPGQKKTPNKRAVINLIPVESFDEDDISEEEEDLDDGGEGAGESSDENEQAMLKEASGNLQLNLKGGKQKTGSNFEVNGGTDGQRGSKGSQGSIEKKRPAKDKASEAKAGKRKR